MKLSEAIRVAEKFKPWLNRSNEWRTALDALIAAARTQAGEPTPPEPSGFGRLFADVRSEVVKSWDEFTESVFDLPPCADDPAPAPEPVREPVEIVDADGVRKLPEGSIYVACSSTGVPERSPRTKKPASDQAIPDPIPADWTSYRVMYRADGWAEPKPAAPKPGDEVPDREAAIKLPEGTLLADRSGRGRGLVVRGVAGSVVRWASPGEEQYPATIVDVNVP